MGIIALIANITKIASLIEAIAKSTKGYKTIIILPLSCLLVIAGCLYFIFSTNKIYEDSLRDDKTVIYVDNILKKCKDKTAVTIGVVSINQSKNKPNYWPAKFKIARACDNRVSKNCIIDLSDKRPALYRESEIEVDMSTYSLFVDVGDDLLPMHFSLRNIKGEQDLKAISFYP